MNEINYTSIEIKYPNGTTTVHIPKLTAEEREKRMNAIKKSIEKLMR